MDYKLVLKNTNEPFKLVMESVLKSDLVIVKTVNSSSFIEEWNDRFNLEICYATSYLKCCLLFNSARPCQPPDFVFEEPFFNEHEEDLYVKVPSLKDWNVKKPEALTLVIHDLIMWYKEHQLKLIKSQAPSFHRAYIILSETMTDCPEPLIVENYITLMFKISINLRNILTTTVSPRLKFGYSVSLKEIKHEIILPLELHKYFLGFPIINRPQSTHTMSTPGNIDIHSVILTRTSHLQDKVDECQKLLCERQKFMSSIASAITDEPIRYDQVFYQYIEYLMDYQENFKFQVSLRIPDGFPTTKPIFLLKSVVNSFSWKNEHYPYSQNTTPVNIAKTFLECLLEWVPQHPQLFH